MKWLKIMCDKSENTAVPHWLCIQLSRWILRLEKLPHSINGHDQYSYLHIDQYWQKILQQLHIDSNPWECDCHLKKFRDFIIQVRRCIFQVCRGISPPFKGGVFLFFLFPYFRNMKKICKFPTGACASGGTLCIYRRDCSRLFCLQRRSRFAQWRRSLKQTNNKEEQIWTKWHNI